jgi:hypothetical protein
MKQYLFTCGLVSLKIMALNKTDALSQVNASLNLSSVVNMKRYEWRLVQVETLSGKKLKRKSIYKKFLDFGG